MSIRHLIVPISLVTFSMLTGWGSCEVDKFDHDSGDPDTGTDTGTSEDSDEPEDTDDDVIHTPGTVEGNIYYQLYTTDANGDIAFLDWEDWYGTDFPFGKVFVSGLSVDEDGYTTYWDETVIGTPTSTGDDYELEFGFDTATEIYVYAALDYWGDGLIASYDPSSVYPDLVTVTPDTETGDIDITISVPYTDFAGGGTWDPDAWVLVSGDVEITESYADGTCLALVYDSSGYGPYGAASFTPTATSGGATGSYSVYAPKAMGDAEILGAWDSNLNELIDPADQWGGYTTDGDSVATVEIGSNDMPGYDLTIPLGTKPISVVPFVVMGGDVTLADEVLTELTATSVLYITAQKYLPSGPFDPTDEDRTYDFTTIVGTEIVSDNAYSLLMPANTVAYFWACIDADGDGYVNEEADPCGQPTSDGKLATGTSSNSAVDMSIDPVTE